MSQNLSHHGIGASEISAIAGLNPYASPWDIWLRKTGQEPEQESSAPMEWGNRLEPAIRQAYCDKTQNVVMVPASSMFHHANAWARATPDGIVVDQKPSASGAVWQALVQCKNVGTWVEKAWKDAPPAYVQLQEAWEMYVTDTKRADVAVLIGGNDFRIYTVHRDDKLIADLVEIASEFWGRVQSNTPPEIDGSDACTAHFEKRLAKADAVELVADAQLNDVMSEWLELHGTVKDAEKRIKTIRNTILSALGDAKADRILSEVGTAKLQKSGGNPTSSTNWKIIAELLGSTRCAADEWKSLLDANTVTGTTPVKQTLYAPRAWAKEQS